MTSFKDMTGRRIGNEISQTYADTGEPTGVTGPVSLDGDRKV